MGDRLWCKRISIVTNGGIGVKGDYIVGGATTCGSGKGLGRLRFNTANKKHEFCDGTKWTAGVAEGVMDVGSLITSAIVLGDSKISCTSANAGAMKYFKAGKR